MKLILTMNKDFSFDIEFDEEAMNASKDDRDALIMAAAYELNDKRLDVQHDPESMF